MKHYFEAIGRLDPFDVLGLPSVVPRLSRWKVRPMLRLFETAIDTIVSTRRRRIAEDPAGVPRDILTLLLEARDPETGEGLSEVEVRANILTFIAAGHETTANSITWSLFLLSQSPEWCSRVQAEADRELDGDIGGLADRLVETPRSGPTNSRASPSGAAPWSSLRPTCCTGITPYGPIPIASIPAASSATRARPSIVLLIFRSALARVSASGPAWPCRRHRSLWRPSCGTSPWNWRRVTWSRQSIG
jgi:cytochrome P450